MLTAWWFFENSISRGISYCTSLRLVLWLTHHLILVRNLGLCLQIRLSFPTWATELLVHAGDDKELPWQVFYGYASTLLHMSHNWKGRLKSRERTSRDHQNCGDWHRETGQLETISQGWTSRDLTTRHQIARVDIVRLDNVRPYSKGGHRETWQRGTR